MKRRLAEEVMAMRVAREFRDGDCVNLGIGIPNLCALLVPQGKTVHFQSQNGVLGYGPVLLAEERDRVDIKYIDAGGRFFSPRLGMSFFDMGTSFDMIRAGRLDVTVLGAYQVSEKGDIANYRRPGDASICIGGSMDLAVGAKRLIVAMEHCTKEGAPRILRRCSYPLTGKECVNLLVTDIAVVEVTRKGLVLQELAPGWTPEEVQAVTEPTLLLAKDLKEIDL